MDERQIRDDSEAAGYCTASLAARHCLRAGFRLAGETAALLSDYLNLLMRWNRRMNLVGASGWEEALDKLVMDSFWLARFLEQESAEGGAFLRKSATALPPGFAADDPCLRERAPGACPPERNGPADDADWGGEKDDALETWDLGAGAGLPGIALRMVWQRGDYWMVESREKRALFLATALARLNLPRTRVFRGRAETFMAGRRADLILSRAFMPWREILETVRPRLKPEGRVILLTREAVRPEKDWVCAASFSYRAGSATRHFSALAVGSR
jgi:16S rRNA (guanine527-N7)-methyltransferase